MAAKAVPAKSRRRRAATTAADTDYRFAEVLHRAIAEDSGALLLQAARALLEKAANGEHWAVKELAERLDGKTPQTLTGDRRRPITVEVVRFAWAEGE